MSTYSGSVNYRQNNDYIQQSKQESVEQDGISAIVHYSEMQEKLLANLRQQLGKIRDNDGSEDRKIKIIPTLAYSNGQPQSHSHRSSSALAFKNAAVAALKLPAMNVRKTKQNKQPHQNPKRNYPRPWATEKASVSSVTTDNNNNILKSACRPPGFVNQKKTLINTQKQFHSSTLERPLLPNQIRATYMDSFAMDPFHNLRPVCTNCQSPIVMVSTLARDATPNYPNNGIIVKALHEGNNPVFQENVNSFHGQQEQEHQAAQNTKTHSKNEYSTDLWNISNDSLQQSVFDMQGNFLVNNGVVFPDPQKKKHPYLMRILEKTIPGFGTKTIISYEDPEPPLHNNNMTQSSQFQSYKQFHDDNSTIALCRAVSRGNATITRPSSRNNKLSQEGNCHPPMMINPGSRNCDLPHEDNSDNPMILKPGSRNINIRREGNSPQRVTTGIRRDFEELGHCTPTAEMTSNYVEQQESMILLPRYINSSLSLTWSHRSVNEESKPYTFVSKEAANFRNEFSNAKNDTSDTFNGRSAEVTLDNTDEIEGLGEVERAVTYQVFTDQDATENENSANEDNWNASAPHADDENELIVHNIERKELNANSENATQRKRKCKRRNQESSGDESYGSMKVTRDPKEDLIKRIDEDFKSYEDMCRLQQMYEEEANNNYWDEKDEQTYSNHTSRGDVRQSEAIKVESRSRPLSVKTKDSRSLLRHRKSLKKKRIDSSSVSVESCRIKSSAKLPVVKKSASWSSQNGALTQNSSQTKREWPPLVIDKYFPEVDKVLEEARSLSPYVGNLDKLFQAPIPKEKTVEDKVSFLNSKLTKFPSWFREVEPISKLGEHLTISKAFHIDIKPGQFRCEELEKFVANSVGAFNERVDSQSSVKIPKLMKQNSDSKKLLNVEEKSTKILRTYSKSDQAEFSDSENIRRISQLISSTVKVENTKKRLHKKFSDVLSTTNRKALLKDFECSRSYFVPKVSNVALKVLTPIRNNGTAVLSHQSAGNETLKTKDNKVPNGIVVGESFGRRTLRNKNMSMMQAIKVKSAERVRQLLAGKTSGKTLNSQIIQNIPKIDRKKLKLLLEKPELFSNISSKLNSRKKKQVETIDSDENNTKFDGCPPPKKESETLNRPQTRRSEEKTNSIVKMSTSRKKVKAKKANKE